MSRRALNGLGGKFCGLPTLLYYTCGQNSTSRAELHNFLKHTAVKNN